VGFVVFRIVRKPIESNQAGQFLPVGKRAAFFKECPEFLSAVCFCEDEQMNSGSITLTARC